MRQLAVALGCASLALAGAARPNEPSAAAPRGAGKATSASPTWSSYLDYAYVYTSADPAALKTRLAQYGTEAGVPLRRYIEEYFETLAPFEAQGDESETRRKAIAYLLDYLATGRPETLEHSVEVIRELRMRLDRPENRFWYHYIQAHWALEKGYARDFTDELLEMWLQVVVPLEALYDTLDTLSLSNEPNSGFAAALPYLYENISRLILVRSQERGLDRDLDPLGAIVRLLADGRIGGQPEIIPPEASSRQYLDRIVTRLDGPESDDGSLTFTLTLFEATRRHEEARGLLAERGLGDATVRAMRAASSAYETAFRRAITAQGECAIYTRALRQIGELYAARQRLKVDPEIEMPFSIEGAIDTYSRMHAQLHGDWQRLGYRTRPRSEYVAAMHHLWEEIQEASLNAADFFLARASEQPQRADEYSRNAAALYTRYLSFFERFATESGKEGVPDSAYFAAYEAARGVGDAYLSYAKRPSRAEVDLGTRRYLSALQLFPFDREVWSALTASLGRHGREAQYAELARPIADRLAHSRAVQDWIEKGEPQAAEIEVLRRALTDTQVLMYLGFADASGVGTLEQELQELVVRRDALQVEIDELGRKRDSLRYQPGDPAASDASPPAAAAEGEPDPEPLELASVARELAEKNALLTRIEQQISARSRALPIYRETIGTEELVAQLRTRRDHPLHALLRRMYHEARS
jgi:hypothetical protein